MLHRVIVSLRTNFSPQQTSTNRIPETKTCMVCLYTNTYMGLWSKRSLYNIMYNVQRNVLRLIVSMWHPKLPGCASVYCGTQLYKKNEKCMGIKCIVPIGIGICTHHYQSRSGIAKPKTKSGRGHLFLKWMHQSFWKNLD